VFEWYFNFFFDFEKVEDLSLQVMRYIKFLGVDFVVDTHFESFTVREHF
jgi:hypothetical protein